MWRLVLLASLSLALLLVVSCGPSRETAPHDRHTLTAEQLSSVVTTYIKAGLAGDPETVAKLCVPGRASARQAIHDLPEITGVDAMAVVEIWAASDAALVIGSKLPDPRRAGRERQLIFLLLRDGGNQWLIDDVDFENVDGVRDEVRKFQEQRPNPMLLSSSGKMAPPA